MTTTKETLEEPFDLSGRTMVFLHDHLLVRRTRKFHIKISGRKLLLNIIETTDGTKLGEKAIDAISMLLRYARSFFASIVCHWVNSGHLFS